MTIFQLIGNTVHNDEIMIRNGIQRIGNDVHNVEQAVFSTVSRAESVVGHVIDRGSTIISDTANLLDNTIKTVDTSVTYLPYLLVTGALIYALNK